MPTIVFASDSHLNKHYARMTPDQLSKRRAQLRAGLQQTIDFAIGTGADIYIHGGDLFDGPNPRAVEMIWAARQFRRLADAGVRTFLIGGNHDIPKSRHVGATPQRLFETMGVAHVFTDPTRVAWEVVEADGLRIAIGGLPPDPRLAPDDDPLAVLEAPIEAPPADARILVTHYAVEGRLHPLAEEATIGNASIAALATEVDYLLVGHIHEAIELDVGGVRVLFPGPTERMSFGELEVACGFAQLEVTRVAQEDNTTADGRPNDDRSAKGARRAMITSRHLHLDPQPMRRETLRAGDIPADEPTAWVIEQLRGFSAPDQILQLRLDGPLGRETYHALRIRDVLAVGADLNFFFDLDRRSLRVRDEAAHLAIGPAGERVSARAEIARVASAMAEEAEDEQTRAIILEARALVLARYSATIVDDDESPGSSRSSPADPERAADPDPTLLEAEA
jgi:DNA repair exonuclease SbcCD nuclease subunit